MTMPDDTDRLVDQWSRFLTALETDCPVCAGGGLVPTPLGRRLTQFLLRHGFVTGPDVAPPPPAPGAGGTNGGRP